MIWLFCYVFVFWQWEGSSAISNATNQLTFVCRMKDKRYIGWRMKKICIIMMMALFQMAKALLRSELHLRTIIACLISFPHKSQWTDASPSRRRKTSGQTRPDAWLCVLDWNWIMVRRPSSLEKEQSFQMFKLFLLILIFVSLILLKCICGVCLSVCRSGMYFCHQCKDTPGWLLWFVLLLMWLNLELHIFIIIICSMNTCLNTSGMDFCWRFPSIYDR